MAERRMFAKSVVLADQFLALSPKTRCLYFALGMSADDDGFVGNPKSICRLCGAGERELQTLLEKGYVYLFDSGVAALRHWRTCNLIRADRHKPTDYTKEREKLIFNGTGEYLQLGMIESTEHA